MRAINRQAAVGIAVTLSVAACGGNGADDASDGAEEGAGQMTAAQTGGAALLAHLDAGGAAFGLFSGDHTPEQAAAMAEVRPLDFVFYSLESGPFDIPALEAYASALRVASGERSTHPILLRIPPIRDGHEEARSRTLEGLGAGVAGIVFPHVETPEEAALAVAAVREFEGVEGAEGSLIVFLLIEDQVGIDNVRQIVGTPGVNVVSPGPGDLRRVYEGDMEQVEDAIQTVLSACLDSGVPCGVTAGADDVALRLEEGFQTIIATQAQAVDVGMVAEGR